MENTVLLEGYQDQVVGLQTSATLFLVIVFLLLVALFICVLLASKYKLYGFGSQKISKRKQDKNQKSLQISAELQ